MRLNTKTYILILGAITMVSSLVAQESNASGNSFLEAVYQTYSNANTYEMYVTVEMYDEDGSLSYPKQENKTIKSGNNFYIQTPELTSVQTANFQLLINHSNKEMSLVAFNEVQKKEYETMFKPTVIPDFSEMTSEIKSIENKDNETVVVFKESPQYKKTVYTFNSNSKLLEQVDYYAEGSEYGQPAHIQIVYSTNYFNDNIDSIVFDLENYVVKDGNELIPSSNFKTYSLINNTINP